MADLIIKPNSATGDKLILQDRAGGAVMTTADSGAAMASNVTGIPAAGVTGVLPVGVTGGSGLTAFGTVVTGNISNTAIVYPAGHVVYKNYSKVSASSGVTNDAVWHNATNIFITIPAAICNTLSSLIVHMTYQMLIYKGTDPHHFATSRIARTAPSTVTDLGQQMNSGHNGGGMNILHPIYDTCSNCIVDSSLSNADHTYYLQAYANSGYCSELNPAQTGATITVWGIK